MQIKRSAMVGEAINHLTANEEINGEQLAMDLNVSPQLVSHMKTGRRKMQADIAQESIQLYDDPSYAMDILYEFSGGYTSPVLRGKSIEQHRLAFWANAKQELEEGLEKLRTVCIAKPPSEMNQMEMESVKTMVDELIESRIHIDNFLMRVQVEYKEISIKDRIKSLVPRWKAKGWLA